MKKIALLIFSLTFIVSFSNAQTFQHYRGTLHSHTGYSDGNKDGGTANATAAFTYAKASLNMNYLGISEHNHATAGLSKADYHTGQAQAATSNQNGTFVALSGMEWGVISQGGHLLVYGFGDSLIGWESGNYDILNQKTDYNGLFTKIANKKGAFASLAHPNSDDYSNLSNIPYNPVWDKAIVGTAVKSGPAFSTNTTYTNPATSNDESYYKKLLALGYHLGPMIDHDTHNTTFGRATQGRTVVLATELTNEKIMEGFYLNRFYASDDYNCKVTFTIKNKPMGSVFTEVGNPTIEVTVTDDDNETTSSIQIQSAVYKTVGGVVTTTLANSVSSNTLTFTDNTILNGQTKYYYIVVTQADGNKVWTSPIWYTRNDLWHIRPLEQMNKNLSQ